MSRKVTLIASLGFLAAGCQTLPLPGQVGRAERDIAEINQRVASIETEIDERTSVISQVNDGIRSNIRYRPIISWANTFSSGPAEQRTVSFRQTSRGGDLIKQSRRCRLYPPDFRNGYYARIHESDSTRAQLFVNRFDISTEQDGLVMRAPLSFRASSQIQGQWEPPCTGSSVGTNVGVTGEANPTTVFRLQFSGVEEGALKYSLDLVSPNRIGVEIAFQLQSYGVVRFTIPMENLAQRLVSGSADLLFDQNGEVSLPDGQIIGYRVTTVDPRISTSLEGVELRSDVSVALDRGLQP